MIAASAATASYVYGIVGADAADAVEHEVAKRTSVGGGARVVRAGSLAALVSEVPLAEFAEDVLPERLNDRDWVEQRVRAHEDVLQAALAETAVVPLRFGAIYSDADDVTRMVAERSAEFEGALARVQGRVEVGVKAYLDRETLEGAVREHSGEAEDAAGSGRAYLLRRQLERRVAAEAADIASDAAAAAHERLLALAVDGRLNRPQPPELSGRSEQMILNAAYLVERGDRRLEAEVATLQDEYRDVGITLELTGPWPPYNFVGGEAVDS